MADGGGVISPPSRSIKQSIGSLPPSTDPRKTSQTAVDIVETNQNVRNATGISDSVPGVMDLELLSSCGMDRTRMIAVLKGEIYHPSCSLFCHRPVD
jgi:hypothetical protein